MKLHLGCGKKHLGNDWIHIDIKEYDNVDIVMNIKHLDFFRDGSVDEIYACHVLEHFKKNEVMQVLAEWFRVLKSDGGILRLAVPDFESVVNLYNSKKYKLATFHGLIYGGKRDEYDIHYDVYDETHLSSLLLQTGFKNVKRYDWRDFLPDNYDDYSRAYIPHMDFENGTLVSLNVVATK